MTTQRDRVLSRSIPEPNTGCWLWLGYLTPDGYGRISLAEKHGVSAHRLSYTAFRGPIPDGLTLDPLCRVRSCVNPDHLEAVPIGVNVLRGTSTGALNAKKTHCLRGHSFEESYVSNGKRHCLACHRMRSAASKKRKRAASVVPSTRSNRRWR